MSHFAIEVVVRVRSGQGDEFTPLILANARAAVRDEPGCRDFRVFRSEDDPDTFVLVEEYDDAAALEAHRATPHYAAFGAAAGDLIVEKTLRRLAAVPT